MPPPALGPLRPVRPAAPLNVLLMVIDDAGIDQLAAYDDTNHYAEPYPYAATPNLDRLAAQGLRFRQCRVSSRCSPTRAQIQTGRYSFRTGVGGVVQESPAPNFGLQPSEVTLPKLLRKGGYRCAAVGKWHLGNSTVSGQPHAPDSWRVTPHTAGYEHFAGCLFNLNNPPAPPGRPDYFNWLRVENGLEAAETRYATTRQADDALRWLKHAPEPWFLYLPWSAIHGPFNWPPAALHSFGPTPPDQMTPGAEPRALNTRGRAMLEALDVEIGRVLDGIPPAVRARTMVLFVGDNGTDSALLRIHATDIRSLADRRPPSLAPYDARRFKNSMYEGGIRVPLLVQGPLVNQPGREVDHLVDGVDLFRTVLSIASLAPSIQIPPPPAVDGVDLLPLLVNPAAGPVRDFSFAEAFSPNGLPASGPLANPALSVQRAYVSAQGLKWIERQNVVSDTPPTPPRTEVFDVFQDPLELSPLDPAQHEELSLAMQELLAS